MIEHLLEVTVGPWMVRLVARVGHVSLHRFGNPFWRETPIEVRTLTILHSRDGRHQTVRNRAASRWDRRTA